MISLSVLESAQHNIIQLIPNTSISNNPPPGAQKQQCCSHDKVHKLELPAPSEPVAITHIGQTQADEERWVGGV